MFPRPRLAFSGDAHVVPQFGARPLQAAPHISTQARTGQQVLWSHPRHAARDGQRHCKDLQTEEALNSGNRPHDTYREGRKGDPKVDVQVRLRSAID